MKKIVCAVVMVVGMNMFAGCADTKESFTERTYTMEGTQVAGISMDVRDREIEVSPSRNQEIHIDYFESDKEFYEISLSDEGVLTMNMAEQKKWKDYIGGNADAAYRKIFLQIPEGLLANLTLKTTKEDILLSEVEVTEEMVLSTKDGNITFEKVHAGEGLELHVKNGNIDGTIAGGYDDFDIRCSIKKGESNLPSEKKGGDKKLQVSANNGNVTIEFE